MNTNKQIHRMFNFLAMILFLGFHSPLLFAQDPGGGEDAAASPFDNSPDALGSFLTGAAEGNKKVNEWLQANAKEGSIYKYATESVVNGRSAAFGKAMLAIQGQIATELAGQVMTEAERAIKQGAFANPQEEVDYKNKYPDTAASKLTVLVNAKLDQALANEGIKPDSPEAKPKMEELASSDFFKRFIIETAKAEVAGVVAKKTFFDGKSVTVIGQYSPTTQQLAAAMLGKEEFPSAPLASQSVQEWVRSMSKIQLYSSFGATLKADNNGDIAVVGFGVYESSDKGPNAATIGQRNASLEAAGYIRDFIGASVAAENKKVAQEASLTKMNEKTLVKASNDSQFIAKAKADFASLTGKTDVRYELQALKGGKVAHMIVAVWTATQSSKANNMREKLNAVGGGKGGTGGAKIGLNPGGGLGGAAKAPNKPGFIPNDEVGKKGVSSESVDGDDF
jgi:hypothetical protein